MIIKKNRKATYDYEVLKTYDAGIVLDGWEVKSIKSGNFSFEGSFIIQRKGELLLIGLNVGNWSSAKKRNDQERTRDRKLLLNKSEVRKVESIINQNKRLTIVPLEFFLVRSLIKIKIGIAKGKRKYEKKEKKKRKDFERELKVELKYI